MQNRFNSNALCDDNKIIEYFQSTDIREVQSLFAQFDSRNIEYLCETCLSERAHVYNESITYTDKKSQVSSYSCFKDKDIVLSLLCVLLEFPSTMKRSIYTVFELLRKGELHGKCATRCVGQIHAVLYKLRFEVQQMDTFKELLVDISQGVLSLVKDFDVDIDNVNGIISAIELLPTITSASQYLHHREDINKSEEEDKVSDSIVSQLLSLEIWHAKFFLVLLNVFVDIDITPSHALKLVTKIKESVDSIDSNDYMGFVKLLLQLADKYQCADFIYIIRSLFSRMSPDMRLNICFVIEMEFRNSHSLMKLLLNSIKLYYANKNSIMELSFSQHLCDLVVLLISFNHEMFTEEVFGTLTQILLSLSKYDGELSRRRNDTIQMRSSSVSSASTSTSTSSSSGTSSDSVNSYVEKLCFAGCHIDNISEVILTICNEWCYKSKLVLRNLGESVLIYLFGQCPSTREQILSTGFNVIAEVPKPIQKQLYLRVLISIAEKYPTILIHDYLARIKDWLSYLPSFTDLQISMQLLNCFTKLTRSSPDFHSFFYIMLKKLIGKRNVENRQLAIYGLTVLMQNAGRDIQRDIISSLKIAFSFHEESLKLTLYKYLTELLQKTTLDKECIKLLYEILDSRVKRFFHLNSKSNRWTLDIINCFEDNGTEKEPNIEAREPLTELIKCYFTLYRQTRSENDEETQVHKEIASLFKDLYTQLVSDLPALCTTLAVSDSWVPQESSSKGNKGKSILADPQPQLVRKCKDYDVTPHMRLSIILPLYEIMIVSSHSF
jgi:hypothetical protein